METNRLKKAALKDGLDVAALLLSRAALRLRALSHAPSRAGNYLRARNPERLLIAPQDIRTVDPTVAADILGGYFAFEGQVANAGGQSPFALDVRSDVWHRQLAGFGWLRHLRAANSEGDRGRSRVLVEDFLAAHSKPSPSIAWEPNVAARRLLSWLSQSPIILDGADNAFYRRFIDALARHHSFLVARLSGDLAGTDRFLPMLASAEYGLCLDRTEGSQKRATEALSLEIGAQIFPDGGSVSRNPQELIDLLLDLLPLRQAYAARSIPAPKLLLNAIDRMMPMLRLLRHSDGTLALFNGMGQTAPEAVATVLAYDAANALPPTNAPHAGYQRLEAGQSVVIVDAGGPPPRDFSACAHAGCLAFEFSCGSRKLVTSCGSSLGGRGDARDASRSTAAHSTLVVADTSSCRFARGHLIGRWLGDRILSGPSNVNVTREEIEGASSIALSHDGYARSFGVQHERWLTLSNSGDCLHGRDRVTHSSDRNPGSAPQRYAIRFHLGPAYKLTPTDSDLAIRIDATDGEGWLFESDKPPSIEASILFAAPGGPRPISQIVLSGVSTDKPETNWTFRRVTNGSHD